jgi:hypothetical protein
MKANLVCSADASEEWRRRQSGGVLQLTSAAS